MVNKSTYLSDLLADTWWFGLTSRLSERGFETLASLRAEQGFSAVQLVVGIPPEVGPENENARSPAGFPWDLDGHLNESYLEFARERILYLNTLGLRVIVYGGWGHQINWLGQEKMAEWWRKIVESLDHLDVIYCLCGESNLWLGRESALLPDKSTDDLKPSGLSWLSPSAKRLLSPLMRRLAKWLHRPQWERRRLAWGFVLEDLSRSTERPILVHPVADETGYEALANSHWLAANTAQTGHDERSRDRLWKLPLTLLEKDPLNRGYINLEPWYEGIKGQFWAQDQLFAYWASVLAGAIAHCYGAHGIWNVSDGEFLTRWGKQTFAQALALDTPRLLGRSHKQYLRHGVADGKTFYRTAQNQLIIIGKKTIRNEAHFFPDVARAERVPAGRIWLPLEGTFAEELPREGPVVIFRSQSEH